ncbi:hypothetical protein F0562_015655 [Nyssa sinensis]|uniref:Uncharacterized protein n=1 Tax=Nyssa sinensis TaxID=561372 RepID=A0A5J4ZM71_9ASTE|nr:hypothetical protein F0562_015655 [Nyssa sinensis]
MNHTKRFQCSRCSADYHAQKVSVAQSSPASIHGEQLTAGRGIFQIFFLCKFQSLSLSAIPSRLNMATKYIISSLVGSFALAFACDYIIADKKIFGGTTPSTVSNKEWWEETDKKFQAWPRTAGPPVVMNPISRQNFIVKSHSEA